MFDICDITGKSDLELLFCHSLPCATPMDVKIPTTNTDDVSGINVAQW